MLDLQDQNAALARLTRLVTRGVDLDAVFDAAVSEVARTLDGSACLLRRVPNGPTTVLASAGADADSVESAVASPVVVDGVNWGELRAGPANPSHQSWVDDVAALVALAVASASSRAAVRRLRGEQTALRHVATLVGEGSSLSDLFAAVARAVAQAVEAEAIAVERVDADRSTTVIASLEAPAFPIGSRWPLDEPGLQASVVTGGRPVRHDDAADLEGPAGAALRASGIRSLVAAPIVVRGAAWGLLWAGGKGPYPLPAPAETRLRDFAELAAVAVGNAESRHAMRRLADSEASLRRVATLAAEGATEGDLLAAVAAEAALILDGSAVSVGRYEPGDSFRVVAAHNDPVFEVGSSWPVEEGSLAGTVRAARSPVRLDDVALTSGTVATAVRAAGLASAVGAPIVVDGDVWGMIVVGLRQRSETLPRFTAWYTSRVLSSSIPSDEIAARLQSFSELVGTAISRAQAHTEVLASRARIVEAGDEARRRIERDLHDGTQQRLIGLTFQLQRALAAIPPTEEAARAELEEADRELSLIIDEVQELSRGLHPAQLTRGGLRPALRALARRSPIPVEVAVDKERLPSSVETAVYYVVSEALTNAIKHSAATSVVVTVAADSGAVRATVADDGVGGAETGVGSGLTGLNDRVEAIGGRFSLASPSGGGTTISVELPIAAQ